MEPQNTRNTQTESAAGEGAGLIVSQQHPMTVRYDRIAVGEFTVDLLVEGRVLVELKAVKVIDDIISHSA